MPSEVSLTSSALSSSAEGSRRRAPSSGRGWKNIAAAALPLLACFLGGATEKWAEGVVLAVLGMLLLFDPPRDSLGRAVNVILCALIALAALAFLPAHYFFQPAWRTALIEDFGIKLPATLTPQPAVTAGCFISFIAALSWLYYICSAQLRSRDTRQRLRFFAGSVAALAALCIALRLSHNALPFWHNERGFGPFPNRNQTANLFGLTAIVLFACAYDDLRHGRKRWLAWFIAAAIILGAIVLDFSRAGLGILIVGVALWLAASALRKGSAARIGAGISVLLILLTAILIFGGQTLDRFHLQGDNVETIRSDFRWLIFRDAFQLIRASPWCGIGLGNFEPVFAIFRNASLGQNRALHPESDWLWVWAELGWPAVILILVGGALLLRRAFPLTEGKTAPFRLAAVIAAILFALHGVIDVSAHRVGTAFAGIFLFGLALHPLESKRSNFFLPILFRIGGALFFLGGIALVAAARWDVPLPGGAGAASVKHAALVAETGRNFRDAIALSTRGLQWAPLDWQLYFQRALAEASERKTQAALNDFRRARFLEPNSFDLPLEEGKVWMTSQPTLAITAFREALRRAHPDEAGVYSGILAIAPLTNPAIDRGLENLATHDPELMVMYFGRLNEKTFPAALQRLLQQDPDLKATPGETRNRLFSLWSSLGNPDELADALRTHPEWLPDGWLVLARYDVNKQNFRSAFELARKFSAPKLPATENNISLSDLQKNFVANPNDYATALQLFAAQMRDGKSDDALATVRHITAQPGAPSYFRFLEAEAWAAKGNYERAWDTWEDFHAATTR